MSTLRGNRWATLAIVLIGFFMILIDTTVVNVSIPTIIADLQANLTDIEWIISGYALSFAALLITFGRLGDMYGRRLMFILGLLVFVVSSYFSGEASNASILIIARLFQGVGGAMISPSVLSIISSTFRGRERAAAFGAFGAVSGIAVAVGPILGGYFTTYQTWRWIFRINIPIGLLGMLLAWLVINESREKVKHRLDISGMLTSTIGFFFLVFGLIEGQNYGWWRPNKPFTLGSYTWTNTDRSIIPYTFVLSAIFLAIFLWIQWIKTRRGQAPAVNLDFFKSKTFRYGLVAVAVISLGEFSSLFTMPIFLQTIKGFTPLQSGFATLPLALAALVAAPTSAAVVNRIGSKWIITAGISAEFLGLFLLSRLTIDTAYVTLIPAFAILGAGIGLAIAQNTQVILSEINPMEAGSASGVLNTVRQVGSALGIAIIGAVLSSQLNKNITTQVQAISDLPATAQQKIIATAQNAGASYSNASPNSAFTLPQPPAYISSNPLALAQYRTQEAVVVQKVQHGIFSALADAIASAIRVGSLFVLLGALLSLLIPNIKIGHEEDRPAGH